MGAGWEGGREGVLWISPQDVESGKCTVVIVSELCLGIRMQVYAEIKYGTGICRTCDPMPRSKWPMLSYLHRLVAGLAISKNHITI